MAVFSPQVLQAVLADLRPEGASGDLCVALSGGVDSTVLLAALAGIKAVGYPGRLRAVHINHQLHADAGLWERRSLELAAALGVPALAEPVDVVGVAAAGVEAAARTARYAALHRILLPGEILLTAHHADDQLETVLLALLRGSGVRGLAGMPRCVACAAGWHQRPLLDFTRSELSAWGHARGLSWSEDPSNSQDRYSRSFLRQTVTPLLQGRWPAAAVVASRSAAHLAEASGLLDELALLDHGATQLEGCLKVQALAGLTSARRRNLLRYWLRTRGLPLPSTAKISALEHDVLAARPDAQVCVTWEGAEVRRHRSLLYAFEPLPVAAMQAECSWDWRQPLVLPGATGALHMVATPGGGLAAARLPAALHISARTGGERLALGRGRDPMTRPLKKLLQEARVLPWWRERLPLLRHGNQLVAVADLWIAQEFAATADEAGLRIEWQGRPAIIAPA